jgi:alkylated DNA repair dioxygenase AlkB
MAMRSTQSSLFDGLDPPAVRSLAERVERREIGHGAWLDVCPAWLSNSNEVFELLVDGVLWKAERRPMYDRIVDVPRLVSFYEAGARLPHPILEEARLVLDEHYLPELGERFATTGLCYYRNGADSVAWHGDTTGRGSTDDTMVAILSLGTPRRFLLRPRYGGAALRFELGLGDLLVMGGSCQRTWEHAVPKTTRPTGPRISVQFRPAGVR